MGEGVAIPGGEVAADAAVEDAKDLQVITVSLINGKAVANLPLRRGKHLAHELKRQIQEQQGYPIHAQKLVHGVEEIADSWDLASFCQPVVLNLVLSEYHPGEALIWAAREGHRDAVTALLMRDADHPEVLHFEDPRGRTALHWAIGQERDAVLEALLRLASDEDLATMLAHASRNLWTALHFAAIVGNADICRRLLSTAARGGQVAMQSSLLLLAQTEEGDTPLHLAARYCHVDVVQTLLAADIPAEDRIAMLSIRGKRCGTALHEGLDQYSVREDLLKALLAVDIPAEAKRSLLRARDHEGSTALHLAARSAAPHAVRALLAVEMLPEERVEMLTARGMRGRTLLHEAVIYGSSWDSSSRCLAVLEELMAPELPEEARMHLLCAQDDEGSTALQFAVSSQQVAMAEALKAHVQRVFGADGTYERASV